MRFQNGKNPCFEIRVEEMIFQITRQQLERAVGIEPEKGRIYVQKFDGEDLVSVSPIEDFIEVKVEQIFVDGLRMWGL